MCAVCCHYLPCRPTFAKKHFHFRESWRGIVLNLIHLTFLRNYDLLRSAVVLEIFFSTLKIYPMLYGVWRCLQKNESEWSHHLSHLQIKKLQNCSLTMTTTMACLSNLLLRPSLHGSLSVPPLCRNWNFWMMVAGRVTLHLRGMPSSGFKQLPLQNKNST